MISHVMVTDLTADQSGHVTSTVRGPVFKSFKSKGQTVPVPHEWHQEQTLSWQDITGCTGQTHVSMITKSF